jgi:hypothetical protein
LYAYESYAVDSKIDVKMEKIKKETANQIEDIRKEAALQIAELKSSKTDKVG